MKTQKQKSRMKFRPKVQNKGIKITGKWKPVALDPNLFADEKLDEIVCFEELTDYELVKSSKELKKGVKRTHAGEVEIKSESEHVVKSKKRKKQNAALAAQKVDEEDALPEMEDEPENFDMGVQSEDNGEDVTKDQFSQQLKSKKKREKRKKKKNTSVQKDAPAPHSVKKSKNWSENALANTSSKNVDVSAWKNLYVPQVVLKALSYLGFACPTPIQALALPSAIRDKMDILGAAETGSGKTLAFAIPMIHSILEWQKRQEYGAAEGETEEKPTTSDGKNEMDVAEKEEQDMSENEEDVDKTGTWDKERPLLGLVVTPTRELAVQVKHHIDAVAKFTGIRTAIVVGGMAPQKQQRLLDRRPEIVIATPGRLWELIRERHPHLRNLRQLRCLVIDEADRMVEKGHYAELSQLFELLSEVHYNSKRQTFVFSATLTLIHQAPTRLLQKKKYKKIDKDSKLVSLMEKIGMKDKPKVIDLTRKQATVETLTETRIHCATEEKDFYLYYFLLQYPGRTMVFANSIDCIKRLSSLLTILDCNPLPMHANMHQKQRLKNLERFAERESCVLLTTDVAARGLDIPNVQHVIHYQVPRTSETYVHRSGRTARASSDGLTLLLIGPNDMINFKKIFRTLEKNEELPDFPVESKCMSGIKERVNLARMIEKMEYFNCKAKQQNSWLQQAAEALELDLDDDVLVGGQHNEEEERVKQKSLKIMKKQLKQLLSQPIFRNSLKTKYPTQTGKLVLPSLLANQSESALLTISKQKGKKRKA
uniref:ATP-dependent RNA helicase n=1 Tax=Xenopus tropicalis TaxID=8364 RepID=A0A6I8RZT6_XENTR